MSGRIPELNLKTGCADDFSFEFHKQTIFLSGLTITCDSTFNLDDFNLSFQEMQLIFERCPNAYNHGNCSTASSRGPVLLLQSNRFSCSLPTRVTSEAGVASLRSLILMGNMLGNGTKALPDWVHDTENQPFLYLDGSFLAIYLSFLDPQIPEAQILKPWTFWDQQLQSRYVSSLRGQRVLTMLVSLGAIFAAALYSLGNCSTFLLGGFENQEDQTGKAHVFVMRIWFRHLDVCFSSTQKYIGC